MVTRAWVVLGVIAGLFLVPAPSAAQRGAAEISGVARDSTGGVLPGVTVEAASPALIEKVKTVVTDESGAYRLLDLRPGSYTVTFTLPGFTTVKREGVELTANFTAQINADLRVGDVSETITVSGQSPVVDVQNVIQQRTLSREVLDALPTGKYYQNYAVLIPGIIVRANVSNSNQDVGGLLGNVSSQMAIHGSRTRDQQILVDGMNVNSMQTNSVSTFNPQDGNIEEFNVLLGANPAESETGGVRINLVPKDGGNQFKGGLFFSGTNSSFQANNVDADLTARGLTSPNRLLRQYDFAAQLGGPVKRDKLWFFGAYRYFPNDRTVGGVSYAKDPKAWIYEADLTRPGVQDTVMWDANMRLTWQLSPKNKINGFFDYNYQCDCHRYISATTTPEASVYLEFWNKIGQVSWSSPVSSRLLLEAGVSYFPWEDKRDLQEEATEIQIVEQARGLTYRSSAFAGGPAAYPGYTLNYRGSMAYVTRAHSMKFGFTSLTQYLNSQIQSPIGDISYRVLNGVPNQVTYYATPYNSIGANKPNMAFYAQDQWTLNKLTLNAGVRFDWMRSEAGAVSLPATRWMVAREFPETPVVDWKDINPRLSGAYDVFGNGKTALKVSMSRYVLQQGIDYIAAVNPVLASNNTAARTWTDLNGDFAVQGDPFNNSPNGELGPQSNVNFGRTVITTRSDPELDRGWHRRPFNWETSAGIQHELVNGVSVTATYFRRWFGNFVVTDNLATAATDFTPFCITAPRDVRLPEGGGYQICGLNDVNPARFGQINNLRTRAQNYGEQSENWNGYDLTMNARLGGGVLLQGGMSGGKTMTDACEIATKYPNVTYTNSLNEGLFSGNTPAAFQVPQYCHVETPWLTNVRFVGAYPLPYGVQISATFQNNYGAAMYANYVATNASIAPSLGRNLAAGANASVTLNVVEQGTMYLDRMNQVDIRFTKEFRFGQARLKGLLDLYNALNSNTVLTANNTYGTNGAAWLVPQVILAGRIIKIGAQLNF